MNSVWENALEGLEAKSWLLVVTRMEVSLARQITAAQRDLIAAGGTCDADSSSVTIRISATIARLDAEFAAVDRTLASAVAKNVRAGKLNGFSDPSEIAASIVGARRGRGRPRKENEVLGAEGGEGASS